MVPEGWAHKSLYECLIGSSLRNKGNKLSHDDLRSVNKSLGMVNMKDQVKGETVDRCKIVKKDWFAYNPMRLNVGSICRWKVEDDCLVSPDYVVFYCNEELLLTEYFDQFRRSHKWNDFMVRAGNGSVRVRIYLKDLTPLKLVLPPLSEQKKIARILSTWDRAIEVTEKLLNNSQQQKKALMQQLLTGKKRLPGFSREFKRFHFSDLLKIDAESLGKKTPNDFEFDYISLSDVMAGRISSKLDRHKYENSPSRARRVLTEGDLLFATVRPNLQGFAKVSVAHADCIASTGFSVLTPKKNMCGDYVYHYLFSAHITGQINALVVGTNYPAINSSDVAGLSIYCPEYEEQKRIADILNNCDSIISSLQNKLNSLRQEKKALMQQLLTGKRRVMVGEDELPQKEAARA
ncbi:MAG: restriction endonuclease subunit S [Burkholderiales bacterium]|nr:restriction endonuclease subunit S [Nitrosomonas sp.]MCP5275773.1 restriction endonuclease subunit S [Burkholderiales bacterium]